MPLSEEELRLLEQMERALVEEDPKFASTLRGTTLRSAARRRAILAGIVFVAGVAVLMGGAISELIPVALVGFVIMLASATYGLTTMRGAASAPATAEQASAAPTTGGAGFTVIQGGRSARRPRRQPSGSSFMERMEERWRRRRDQGF